MEEWRKNEGATAGPSTLLTSAGASIPERQQLEASEDF